MKLTGAWRKDYAAFYDSQEAKLIDAMDNADSIHIVYVRLQALAVKCGCGGKLLLHGSVPYTDEMLAAITGKTVPALRQAIDPLVQLALVIKADGIYAIADWELNQDAAAIDSVREGNRLHGTRERKGKTGKGCRQMKREKVLRYLSEHPEATNTEVAEKTGVSRPSVIKYRSEYAPALPAPEDAGIVKVDGAKVDTVKIDSVKVDSFDSKVDVNFDVKVDSDFDTGFYTDEEDKPAGSGHDKGEKGTVKIASRPKNIDDRYKTSSSTSDVMDRDNVVGRRPTREDVRRHFEAKGYRLSPDRFFDLNESRGWVTKSGKPVDDWKGLAATWESHEGGGASPAVRPRETAKEPTVEEVMALYGCPRDRAELMIREGMY